MDGCVFHIFVYSLHVWWNILLLSKCHWNCKTCSFICHIAVWTRFSDLWFRSKGGRKGCARQFHCPSLAVILHLGRYSKTWNLANSLICMLACFCVCQMSRDTQFLPTQKTLLFVHILSIKIVQLRPCSPFYHTSLDQDNCCLQLYLYLIYFICQSFF